MNRKKNIKTPLKEKIYIAKRLELMLSAGISFQESFSIVSSQLHSKTRSLYDTAEKNLAAGLPAAVSLMSIFGSGYVALLKIGEETGTLQKSFAAIAHELHASQELRRKAIGALMYPCMVTAGMMALVIGLITVVFPKISSIFKSLNVELPLSTRVLIWLGDFLVRWGIVVGILFLLAGIGLWIWYQRTPRIRAWIWLRLCTFAWSRRIIRVYTLSHVCRNMGMLIYHHMSVPDAALTVAASIRIPCYSESLKAVAILLNEGRSVADACASETILFPVECVSMIAIGERSGTLAETFAYLGDLYAADADSAFKILGSAVEPVLMLSIGLVIMIIALSIITPMYQITENLHV